MRTGDRIAQRRTELGLSQTQLARLAGVSQPTIGKLEAGISSGSSHLHKIARVLRTSPAFLAGETDDPAEGAPPPLPEPTVQYIPMMAVLPSEDALARMFLGVLEASRGMSEDELAHELAKRLPKGLAVAQGSIVSPRMAPDGDLPERTDTPPGDRSEAVRASHT